ncbi:MAG TPA: transporter substrate-binding domain-containing protein [Burkholderiales bacterium]
MQKGEFDFVATSMTRTRVIVKKSSGITSVRQLSGRKASSVSTSTGGNLKEVVPDVKLVTVRDYAVAFAMLKEGKVAAFTTDETVLRAIVRQDGEQTGKREDYLFLPDFSKSRNVGFAKKKTSRA